MRLLDRGRPLKRWRYVGVFGESLMACAALVQVGPARQSFWALYERESGRLRQRTRMLPRTRRLQLSGGTAHGEAGEGSNPAYAQTHTPENGAPTHTGRLEIRDSGVELQLTLHEQPGWQARCASGASHVWTRKQAGVQARGTLALDGGPARAIEALAVIDDTAGYHARRTEWWWSAGVGRLSGGEAVAWNLVAGVNDPPAGSERAVWVAGVPHEVAPVSFTPELDRIACADGSQLRFAAQAERARNENFLVFKSDYRAPFGSFSGTLPGGLALAEGLGVVEHHRALW
jgi:hypothetical protein